MEEIKKEPKKKLCAVYGSLKQGFGNHSRFLKNAKLVGVTKTAPKFTMHSLGAFPGITHGGDTAIKIEVYEVTEEEDKSIESLEGYYGPEDPMNFYNKEEIETEFGVASIYVINRDGNLLYPYAGGDWQR